jgi:hypothetical protein
MDAAPTSSRPRELYLQPTPRYHQPVVADAEQDIQSCSETPNANLMRTVLS